MKKLLVVSVVTLFGVASHAAQGIYGTWKFESISQGPISFDITLSYTKDTASIKNVCNINGEIIVAEATVPVQITSNTVTTLKSKTDHKAINGIDCNAGINKITMGYSVSADDSVLSLVVSGQGTLVLPRQ